MPTPQKMTIQAFSKPDYSGPLGEALSVQVNPSSFTQNFAISHDSKLPLGESNATVKFSGVSPYTLSFELLFDATGAIPASNNPAASILSVQTPINLEAQIEAFKNTVYKFDGEIHSPAYIKICWGKNVFRVLLTKMDLTYSMFRANGTVLRAKANLSFIQFASQSEIMHGSLPIIWK